VQQRGDQGRGVHAEFGQDLGDGEWVRDVLVAALAQLAGVQPLGDLVPPAQQPAVAVPVDLTMGVHEPRDRIGP
jgi:hypothetical protein